jgi:hypothetical protein
MPVRLYMDAHVHGAVTRGLRARGVDVITAQEDRADSLPDPELLDRASVLGRVLVSFDRDFLAEARVRPRGGRTHAGIVHMRATGIGRAIADLELVAQAADPEYMRGRIEYLPY